MEGVFRKAAFGDYLDCHTRPHDSSSPPPPTPTYSTFDKAELESKVVSRFEQCRVVPAWLILLIDKVAAGSQVLVQVQVAECMTRQSTAEDIIVASGHTLMEVLS